VVLKRDGWILTANSAFERITDLKRERIEGRDCREVEPLNNIWNSISACVLHRTEQTERISYRNMVMDALIVPVMTDGFLEHICIEFRDMSSYVNLENEFLKRNKELVITNALSEIFISSSSLESVYSELLDKVLMISDMSIGWIAGKTDEGFVLNGSCGVSPEFRNRLENGEIDFLYGDIADTEEPMRVFESDDAARMEIVRDCGIVFLAVIPLRMGGEVLGILVLASKVEVEFDFDIASLFSLLGNNLSLIAEKIRLFQETQRLAITDDLTGLHNVRFFYDVLDTEIARTIRYLKPFSLVLFDVDDFKRLNDMHGHQAGDEVLRSVALTIKETLRLTDTVARYGGEEFIAVLPNTDKINAFSMATRVMNAVESSFFLGDKSVRITLSGGVATFPDDAKDAKSILYVADMAMYDAKAQGKKKICCYNKK
jgi:diguanylate cyclase (GGDEF)-like protein